MLIFNRLERLAREHDDARRSVCLYLLNEPDTAERLSMEEVARATHTSKSTLVRVAKELGFSGWRELSRQYTIEVERRRQRSSGVDHSLPFGAGAGTAEVISSVAAVCSEAAFETAQVQDPRELERAVDYVLAARRVGLFGTGYNEHLLDSFWADLTGIGMQAIPYAAGGAHVARMLQGGDCAIVVSYTGESPERMPMCHLAEFRARGVRVVGVTSEGDNYLRESSDAVLTILGQESLYEKVGPFSSRASTACALDMLYAAIFARDYERNLAYLSQSSRELEQGRLPKGGQA